MSRNGRKRSLGSRARSQPPGTVVIPVSDLMRYSEFFLDYSYFLAAGGLPRHSAISMRRSAGVVENLNLSLAEMPEEHEWAWIMGDDHRFGADLLVSLLELELDIVAPLCIKRSPPFMLGCFKEAGDYFDERLERTYPGYKPFELEEVPDEPFPVVASGSAGMLIRKHVLDAIGYPYFESTDGAYLNEDLEFCRKAREHGYQVMVDPHAYLGHIGNFVIWPHHHEGQLVARIHHGGEQGQNEVFLGRPIEVAS